MNNYIFTCPPILLGLFFYKKGGLEIMSETKAHQRRFSLEDDFMNYDTDDLLFGAMYHLSTYHPDYRKLYLSRKSLLKKKQKNYL